jgi:hypothetical protein
MAISFVNATVSASSSSVTYSPTQGNMVVLGVSFPSGDSSGVTCKDQSGNPLALNTDIIGTPVGGPDIWEFYGFAVAGASTYTVTNLSGFTPNAIVIGEYANVSSVGASNTAQGATGSNPETVSLTTTGTSSFMVAVIGSITATPQTSNTGTIRVQTSSGQGPLALVDNTVTSPSSVTCAVNGTGSPVQAWGAVAVELLATIFSPPNPPAKFGGILW